MKNVKKKKEVDSWPRRNQILHMLLEKKNFVTQVLDLSQALMLSGQPSEF